MDDNVDRRRRKILSTIKKLHQRATEINQQLGRVDQNSNNLVVYKNALKIVLRRLNEANRECALDAQCMIELREFLSVYKTELSNPIDIELSKLNQPSAKARLQTLQQSLLRNERKLNDLIRPSSDDLVGEAYDTSLKMDIVQDKIDRLSRENKQIANEMRMILRTSTEAEVKNAEALRRVQQELIQSRSKEEELKAMLAATEQKLQERIAQQSTSRIKEATEFKNFQKEHKRMQETRAKLDQQRFEVEQKVDELKAQKDELQKQLQAAKDDFKRKMIQKQSEQKNGDELMDVKFELEESKLVSQLRRQNTKLLQEKKEALAQLEELKRLREENKLLGNENKVPDRLFQLAQNYRQVVNQRVDLNRRVNNLVAERDQLQAQLANNELNYTQDVRQQTDNLRRNITDLRNEITSKTQVISDLTGQVNELKNREMKQDNQLAQRVSDLQTEVNGLRNENELFKRNSETCEVMKNRELNLLRQQHANEMARRERQKRLEIQQIQQAYARKQIELSRRVETREKMLERKMRQYEEAEQKFNAKSAALQAKERMLEEEKNRLTALNNSQEQDLVNLRNRLASVKNELELVKSQTVTFKQRERDLKNQIKSLRKQYAKEIESLKASLRALRDQYNMSQTELVESKRRANELVEQVKVNKESLKMLQSKISALKNKYKLQKANYERLLYTQKQQGERLLRDNLQLRRMLDDASNAHSHAEQWKSEAENLQNQINSEEKRADSSVKVIAELTRTKNQAKRVNEQLIELQKQLKLDKKKLALDNSDLEQKVKTLTQANADLSIGLSKMNQQAREAVQTAERQMLVESKMREGKQKALELKLELKRRENQKLRRQLETRQQNEETYRKLLESSTRNHVSDIENVIQSRELEQKNRDEYLEARIDALNNFHELQENVN